MFIIRLFQNIRMRYKVFILVAAFVLMAVAVALVGYTAISRLQKDLIHIEDEFADVAVKVQNAATHARQLHGTIAMIMAVDDPGEISALLREYEEAKSSLLQLAGFYAQHLINDRRARNFQVIDTNWRATEKIYDEIADHVRNGRRTTAYAIFTDPKTKNAEDAFISSIVNEADELGKALLETTNKSISTANSRQNMMIWIIVIVFIAGVFTNILVSFTMTRPMVKLLKGIKIFSSGDLTKGIDYYGRDEIAEMGGALVGLGDSLTHAIGSANAASVDLTSASNDFAALAERTSATVEEFRASIDELTGNLTEMASVGEGINVSVREVSAGAHTTAEKGTEIARMVSEAMTVGDEGMVAVRKAVNGIGEVAESSTATAGSVSDLGERARQIQNFVAQIGGIADQTNLLALNAAIEAARAGEAGRGFAVVAEEVRKLAEDSNAAAKSIADLANTITNDLGVIVESAQSNATKSSDAVELSNSTETAIDRMITILRSISGATQDLAAISEEQAASSSEIADSIHSMAERVNKSAETGDGLRTGIADIANAAEDIASKAEHLQHLSGSLDSELAFFTLPTGSPQVPGMKALPARR